DGIRGRNVTGVQTCALPILISLYDPAVDQRAGDETDERDPRWVVCRRSCIIVGGELTLELLELRYDDSSGVYFGAAADEGQQQRSEERRVGKECRERRATEA